VNGRLKHVELIAKRFAELAMAYKGEVKAIVTTVFVSCTSLMARLFMKLVHLMTCLYSIKCRNLFKKLIFCKRMITFDIMTGITLVDIILIFNYFIINKDVESHYFVCI